MKASFSQSRDVFYRSHITIFIVDPVAFYVFGPCFVMQSLVSLISVSCFTLSVSCCVVAVCVSMCLFLGAVVGLWFWNFPVVLTSFR